MDNPTFNIENALRKTAPRKDTQKVGELLIEHKRKLIVSAILKCDGNVAAAARLLGIDRTTMWHHRKSLGLPMKYKLTPSDLE